MIIDMLIYIIGTIGLVSSALFLVLAVSIFRRSSKSKFPNTINIKPSEQDVTIGVGVFPDSMVLPVGIETGFYDRVHLHIKVAYLDWDKIFDHLMADDVSIIIGNKSLCDEKNSIRTFFTYHQDIHFYDGFAILIRPTLNVSTYLELRNRYKNASEGEVRVETLKQLKGMTIIASKHTDHSPSLIHCAQIAGLTAGKDFKILGSHEPYEGLRHFLEMGEGDAYIGGISQRIISLRAGMKELIGQDQIDLGLTQRNGFITTSFSQRISPQLIEQLSYAWFETVQAIRKDNNRFVPMILKYLNMNIASYSTKYQFTSNDFYLYWDKWERFPSTKKESDELLGRILPLKAASGQL